MVAPRGSLSTLAARDKSSVASWTAVTALSMAAVAATAWLTSDESVGEDVDDNGIGVTGGCCCEG